MVKLKTSRREELFAWRDRGIGVVHKHHTVPLPSMMEEFGHFYFYIPENLLCIAGHNYDSTFFEQQMEFHSQPSEAYTVVHFNKEKTASWSHFLRWKKILSQIKSAVDKEYVLFMDPTDTLFIDSPHNILNNFLTKFDCDILYNSTAYRRGYRWDKHSQESEDYHRAKARKFARGGPPRTSKHLCAGLFIGKKDFVIELYEKFLSYELDSKGERDETNWAESLEFPYGCADDQKVLRHMEYEYYPKMQVDGKNNLFLRCN